jgi:phage tail-like protein
MLDSLPTYRYLNLENHWPGFRLQRLEVGADGALRLAALPAFMADTSNAAAIAPLLRGPAGIGVDRTGTLYVADAEGHRILRVSPCDGSIEPLPCLRGPGVEPGALDHPRGVLVGSRDLLYVADAGNHRVQAFDLETHQLRGIWDRGFEEPWDLAEDARGNVYVADPGRRRPDGTWERGRVVRLAQHGFLDPDWKLVPPPGAPTSVAIIEEAGAPQDSGTLLVLDAQPQSLQVYSLDGRIDLEATRRWSEVARVAELPVSLRTGTGGSVHLTDLASGRVLSFSPTGEFLGSAGGEPFEASGLGLDCTGRLVAAAGAGSAIRHALGLSAFAQSGTFLAGPYEADTEPTRWQRVQLTLEPPAPGAHFRLWTLTTDDATLLPLPPVDDAAVQPPGFDEPDAQATTPCDRWRAMPWDAADGLILNEEASRLWIAGTLTGTGYGTPVIRQLRLIHDEEGWQRYLPAMFAREEVTRTFLERALALFETLHERERNLVDDLPLLFDPQAAPDTAGASWLEWLADWVGTELDQRWDEPTRRDTVARAFREFARRGTPAGLRRLAELYAGAAVQFEEEGQGAGLWGLGAPGSALGTDTALAPLAPGGAVLDISAVTNASTLEREPPRGRPAFEVTAHRFVVRVHAALVRRAGQLERLRRLIEREKPAHLAFHLCVIQPAMRVGAQARLGVDSVVAGPPAPSAWDSDAALGATTVLPDPLPRWRRRAVRAGPDPDAGRVPATLT